jgi:hypothetical protein
LLTKLSISVIIFFPVSVLTSSGQGKAKSTYWQVEN